MKITSKLATLSDTKKLIENDSDYCPIITETDKECKFNYYSNILLNCNDFILGDLQDNFCGRVLSSLSEYKSSDIRIDCILYLCGDIEDLINHVISHEIYVVKEYSTNYDTESFDYKVISIGEVPINVYNCGVYFRQFFDSKDDYFDKFNNEHKTQDLSESNKKGVSYRKGIYLTRVAKYSDKTKFKLLRCSTNLKGPTENFRDNDNKIINKVNKVRKFFFEDSAELNHVLGQVYENKVESDNKQKKAKIKKHSDKTKDMPRNGLMAFCTFYKDFTGIGKNGWNTQIKHLKHSKTDIYDYTYKNQSVLTKLHFELKKCVKDPEKKYTKQFDITLYPNSVFMMSLEINRLYTHEIVPSTLPVEYLPTRLGYVIRCSNTDAVFKDGRTYIVNYNERGVQRKLVPLEQPTEENITELRELYYKENFTTEKVSYVGIYYSMNSGDYLEPTYYI